MGSPLPPPPPTPETTEGTPALQNVYRFFKKDGNLDATPSLKSQSSGEALRSQSSRDNLRSAIPPPLPARPVTSSPIPDPPLISGEDPFESGSGVTHERTRTGSSAASALKQIQAEDAARLKEEKEDEEHKPLTPESVGTPPTSSPLGALNAVQNGNANGDLPDHRGRSVSPDPVIL